MHVHKQYVELRLFYNRYGYDIPKAYMRCYYVSLH